VWVQFAAPGDKFDPHLHDALFEYADANKEAGAVGQVRPLLAHRHICVYACVRVCQPASRTAPS
jgi:hypothetical protein